MQMIDIPDNPLPPGGVVALATAGAARIRVARWTPPSGAGPSSGTLLICPGRSEFIEKYAEVVRDLLARGFTVVVFDWRGQGGSSRLLPNPRKGHVDTFNAYLEDLDAVIATMEAAACPRPWFGLGHSMGGAIIADHATRGASPFERLVLSAPMIDLQALRFVGLIRLMARAAVGFGFGSAYVPGGTDRSWMNQPFEGNVLTSDPRRYAAFVALARAAPELLLGSPTQGWLHAAFSVMRRLTAPGIGAAIVTPMLVVGCGADRVVATPAIERFAASIRAGHLIVVPHALHEILMERDAFRDQFWAAFDAFIPGSG